MRWGWLILFSFLLLGCNHDDPENPLAGKIKTLEIIQVAFNTDAMFFNFHYNDAGYLTSMESDSLKFFIEETSTNITEITKTGIDFDPFLSRTQKYRIYTDANYQIQSINLLDTLTMAETLHTTMAFETDNKLDTIAIKGVPLFVSNIASFDYEFDGNNCVKLKGSWNIYNFWNYLYSDTTIYSYTTILNNDFLPLQIPYLNVTHALGGYPADDFLLYLMNINGNRALDKNKYLVSSISSQVQDVYFNTDNNNYQTNFNYVLNASGQVTEMHVSNPDGTGTFMIYKMTYY